MRFAEAEQRYRELEEELFRGELTEEEFGCRAAELRVVDAQGHRWMLSARSGRWLLHDGQQWVFAEPPRERAEPEITVQPGIVEPVESPLESVTATSAAVPAASPARAARTATTSSRLAPRLLASGVVTLLLIGCLIGGGIAAWVFLLRDWGEATPTVVAEPGVSMVATYTPRPATPTYTPTSTPTPSRTPTPTITSIPTETPTLTATNTPLPSTSTPTATSTPTPSSVPSVTDTPAPTATRTATPGSGRTYTVKLGETLSEIAARLGVTVQALAEANGITDPALIRPGQVLVVPEPGGTPAPTEVAAAQTYTVKQGETLYEIAQRFGLTVEALAEANGITNPALIRPGQVLVIPVPGATPAVATTTPTPTWTPIVVTPPRGTATPTRTPTATATRTRTPTPTLTATGPTQTPRPTNTPRPTSTPTPPAPSLSGKVSFSLWNPYTSKYELYVSLIDGSGRNMLGEGFRQPQFRPDGNLLAVNGDGAPNLEHLITMDASGAGKTEVSNYSEDSYPTWSADGAIVAYSSSSWGDGLTRLGIVHDMFGKQQDWIPFGTSQVKGEYPYWMADGRVVYHGCNFWGDGGACGLYWVGAGGGSPQILTTHESDTAPAGSGSRVAFMSARDGNWEVYAVNMDGSNLKRLTNNAALDGLPTWSPDGASIAFVSNRSGAWALWAMNADGTNQRKLFDLEGGYGSGAYDWTTERISWAP